MDKEYSPFYWHNKALRDYPEYLVDGLMDCLREEIGMAMPIVYLDKPKEPTPHPLPELWTKRQWDEVKQIKAEQKNLRQVIYKALKEIKEGANAKVKPF